MTQVLERNQDQVPERTHRTAAEQQTSSDSLVVRWIDSMEGLESIRCQWDELAENVIWSNPAFEHNFLIPAIKHLASQKVRILVVEDSNTCPATGERQLVGLMPLVEKKFYHLPIRCLEVWKHDQCFDTTPLIRASGAVQILDSILNFLAGEKIGLLSLDTISAEPEFQSVLDEATGGHGRTTFQRDSFERAAFRPTLPLDEYQRKHTSKSVKKNYGRLRRRLEEQGDLTCEVSGEDSDYQELANQFLELESSGWKIEAGTALACEPSQTRFYQELIGRSAQIGKARFLTLKLDGQTIAMLSDIQSGDQVFSFKTTFDESFSAYSPGLQIEMRNIECMHRSGIKFADSCTAPDNATINRIWGQRTQFQNLVIGTRPGMAQWATRVMPWIQAAANRIKTFRS